MIAILAPLACFLVVTAAQPIVIRLLRARMILDVPVGRSSHTIPTPRGGGIAVALGLLVGTSVLNNFTWLPLIVAVVMFFAIGLAEDVRGLPIVVRLVLQLLTGGMVAVLLVLSAPRPPIVPAIAVALAALWIAAFTNAFNFMDGINGISGAHTVLGGMAFLTIGLLSRDPSLVVVASIVAAAGLAFLPWNIVNAKVFLGDVGSYTLGAVLAVLAVYALLRGAPIEMVLAPLALYLADTGWTLARRVVTRKDWTEPHREHAYQRLCDGSWSHYQVTLFTFCIGACLTVLSTVSLLGSTPLRIVADVAAVALLVAYLLAPRVLHAVQAARAATVAGGRPDAAAPLPVEPPTTQGGRR